MPVIEVSRQKNKEDKIRMMRCNFEDTFQEIS